MTQRKCGTCRFFEEGGIAASGWCRHPMRQHLEQMVLVRKSELACRNDWDKDLWEPREAGQPAVAPPPSVPAVVGAGAERTATLVRDDTDTLASITVVPLPRPSRPARSAPRLTDAPGTGDEPQPARQAAHSPAPAPRRASEPVRSESSAAREYQRNPAPRGPAPAGQSGQNEMRREPSSRSNRVETTTPRPSPLRSAVEPTVDSAESVSRRPAAAPRPAPERRAESAGEPRFGWLDVEPRPPVAPPPPPAITRSDEGRGQWVETRSGSTEPFEVVQPERPNGAEPVPEAEPRPLLPGSGHAALKGTAAENLTRCCATCRDFRPAEGGQRGWCNNRFAFEQRRMVQGDEIACASSVGNWWVPTDDWWLQRADISHHALPTPTVDEYLQRLLARRREAR